MSALELLLRGFTAGAMLATAVGLLREARAPSRICGALACAAVAAFAVHTGGADTEALGVLQPAAWVLSAGGIGYFWLFARTLFQDRPFQWGWLAPAAVMTLIAALAQSLPGRQADGVWIAHNLLEVVLVVHVLAFVWAGSRGDLVEARRSLRGPFLALVGVVAGIMSGLEIAEELRFDLSGVSLAQAAALAVMSLVGAAMLLQPSGDLFAPRRRTAAIPTTEARDQALLTRLVALMDEEEIWRREGLTIVALAAAAGTSEHRLRRVINHNLGHRNFADYLNARRVAAAQAVFADAAQAETPVSSVAFDLGYASLGPFNRAFKEATGQTPSEWRAQALSPKA
jgi:AraC-like DNA-binding protein